MLFSATQPPLQFSSAFVNTRNLHGTGCSLASAITAYLALGRELDTATGLAKEYITRAIESGAGVRTGKGHGPVNHFFGPMILKSCDRGARS